MDNDPAWWNEVANTPGIKEWVDAGLERVDVSPIFEHNGGIGLRTEHGGFIVIPKPHCVWEPHGFFPKQPNRLNAAIEDGFSLLAYVFGNFPAEMLKVKIHISSALHGTGELLRRCGFFVNYDGGDLVTYSLTRGQYLAQQRSRA